MTTPPLNADFLTDLDFEDEIPDPSALHLLPSTHSKPNQWSPKMIFDLALGLDSQEEIEVRYGLTEAQLTRLYENPQFRKEVACLTRELRENNQIFKSKVKIQAEDYLNIMDEMMYDQATPASTKLSIFQALAKLGELEPKPEKQNPAGGAATININLAMQAAEKRIIDMSGIRCLDGE